MQKHHILSIIVLFLSQFNLKAQDPFICKGDFYLALSQNGGNSNFFRVEIDAISGDITFNQLPNTGDDMVNSLGYRITNNLIYGLNPTSFRLYIIDANGDTYFQKQLALGQSGFYTAADIMPSGDTMVIVGAQNFVSDELVFVDLNDPDYGFSSIPLVYPNGGQMLTTDVAFDPLTGLLWGFDALNNRMITIDPQTGNVDNTTFPIQNNVGAIGAMFFDPFGNLFGYGNPPSTNNATQFFRVNKTTGNITLEATGPLATGKDGCSCPYTIKLQKTVYPEIAFPCTEVTYSFEIANLSGEAQFDAVFSDTMPTNLTITEILQNPFDGDLSGVGTNILTIENLTIPVGIDSLIVKVYIEEGAEGFYKNQAKLVGLPEFLGGETCSDNPNTLVNNDSTCLEVLPLFVDLNNDTIGICNGEEITLFAEELEGVNINYEWNTGETTPTISLNSEGLYAVTVTSGCETVFDSIFIIEGLIDIEFPNDLTIELGETIDLAPTILSGTPFTYFWASNLPETIECLGCPTITVRPFFDATYSVLVTDEFGCEDMDSLQIKVDKNRNVFIPNVFSPNSDGFNDVFYLYSKGIIDIKYFRIFDRWGNLVFEKEAGKTNDPTFSWDGKFKGKTLNPSVFVYVAELEFLDGLSFVYKGDVQLIR